MNRNNNQNAFIRKIILQGKELLIRNPLNLNNWIWLSNEFKKINLIIQINRINIIISHINPKQLKSHVEESNKNIIINEQTINTAIEFLMKRKDVVSVVDITNTSNQSEKIEKNMDKNFFMDELYTEFEKSKDKYDSINDFFNERAKEIPKETEIVIADWLCHRG